MADCIFCKIVNGTIPAAKVYEDEWVVAFNDISPQAPVHILVIPKEHIPDITHLDEENVATVTKMILAANKIAKEMSLTDGFRLVLNSGKDAGQTVFHIHMHLLAGAMLGYFGTQV